MAREIPLANGRGVALVDDEDYVDLNRWVWHLHSANYAAHSTPRPVQTQTLMHRRILGVPKGVLVDHRNGDGLDNRRENLRIATYSLNRFNCQKTCSSNTSGITGVTFEGSSWRVRISSSEWAKGKRLHVGKFADLADAHKARLNAEMKYFGEISPATAAWMPPVAA